MDILLGNFVNKYIDSFNGQIVIISSSHLSHNMFGKIKESSGSKKNTTNNRMELIAAIEAIKYFKKKTKINIYTDSKYLENGITIWIKKWKINNWKTSNKKDVKNSDLWKLLENETKNHFIKWSWVKAHNDDTLNEKADKLAKKAIGI